jgi:hypothetical protein
MHRANGNSPLRKTPAATPRTGTVLAEAVESQREHIRRPRRFRHVPGQTVSCFKPPGSAIELEAGFARLGMRQHVAQQIGPEEVVARPVHPVGRPPRLGVGGKDGRAHRHAFCLVPRSTGTDASDQESVEMSSAAMPPHFQRRDGRTVRTRPQTHLLCHGPSVGRQHLLG